MTLVENTNEWGMKRLGETYQYVFLGIALAMTGASLLFPYAASITGFTFWGIFLLEIIFIFAFYMTKNPIMYYVFTFFTGVTLVPMLSHLVSTGASHVILQALIMTSVITGGLTFYAQTTRRNFLGIGTLLFWVLIAIIIVSLVNIFLIGSSILSLIISIAVAVLFSFFIIHDTQRILFENIEPLEAAMGMYINILNMFSSLLNILNWANDD